jgi:hypothetical protein
MRSALFVLVGLLAVFSVVHGAATSLNKYRQEETQTKIKPVTYSVTIPIAGAPLFCPFHQVGHFTKGSFTITIVETKGNTSDCLMVSPTDCVQINKLKFKVHGDALLNNGHDASVRARLSLANRFRLDTSGPSLVKDTFKFVAELDIEDETLNKHFDSALSFKCKFVPNQIPDCSLLELDFTDKCPL